MSALFGQLVEFSIAVMSEDVDLFWCDVLGPLCCSIGLAKVSFMCKWLVCALDVALDRLIGYPRKPVECDDHLQLVFEVHGPHGFQICL